MNGAARGGRAPRWRPFLVQALVVAVLFGTWEVAVRSTRMEFILSTPLAVALKLKAWLGTWVIVNHLRVTLVEMLAGLAIGALAAVAVGLLCGRVELVGRTLMPFFVSFYSLPKIALAPLFVVWFGIGLESKIALVAVTVFFPVFLNTCVGARDVDPELLAVLRLMGAGPWQRLREVVWPATLPWVLGSARIAVRYALTAAIYGEIVAANRGLGFLIEYSSNTFDVAGVFAALALLMVISLVITLGVTRWETEALRWKV